jgi:hypothetical protein
MVESDKLNKRKRERRAADILEAIHELVEEIYGESCEDNALELSIEKWSFLQSVAEEVRANMWAEQCPLCACYRDDDCEGCPVNGDGHNRSDCNDTPYGEARAAATKLSGRMLEEVRFLRDIV